MKRGNEISNEVINSMESRRRSEIVSLRKEL